MMARWEQEADSGPYRLGWRPVAGPGYRPGVASVIAWSDRRARLALILAVLGLPSLGITVPAAIWLGMGAVRQQRLVSGAEPAIGLIALTLAGLDAFTINSVLIRTFETLEPWRVWQGVAWGSGLAIAASLCAFSSLRIHPERRGALLAVRGGLVAATAGGTALFVRLLTVID